MLGNENTHCLQYTRAGDTYWDKVVRAELTDSNIEFRTAQFLQSAANDEKVMDAPGVNIPTFSITRYPYPEYHTSDDNESLINRDMLQESCELFCRIFSRFERDYIPVYISHGPVCLSEHGLYPNWYKDPSMADKWEGFLKVMYALDDKLSCEELAFKLELPIDVVLYWTDAFAEKGFVQPREFIATK
jgi:aminopeptidase-like protein